MTTGNDNLHECLVEMNIYKKERGAEARHKIVIKGLIPLWRELVISTGVEIA